MALIECSECGREFSDAATACPNCGKPVTDLTAGVETAHKADKPSKKAGSALLGLITWGVIIAVGVWACTPDEMTPEERAAQQAEAQEERRKGFHCLSKWDGSHREFKQAVTKNLRDPDSFEHIETRVTPVKDGKHRIIMEYRARNGFGGMVVGQATGAYANSDCANITLTQTE